MGISKQFISLRRDRHMEKGATKGFPQGLKANLFSGLIGTTKVVPCYKAH